MAHFDKCSNRLILAVALHVEKCFFIPSLFLPGKYFDITLEPSYFITQPIIFGDFIKVRFYLHIVNA